MPRRKAYSNFYVAFQWNFAVDGGAVGSYDTRVNIPAGSQVLIVMRQNIIAPVAGAGGFLGYGTLAVPGLLGSDPQIFYAANNFSAGAATWPGGNFFLTIGVAPLTAGQFNIGVQYFQFH